MTRDEFELISKDKSVEMMIRQLISVFSVTPPVYARPGENGASPSGAREAQPIARSASGMNGSPVPAGPSTSVGALSFRLWTMRLTQDRLSHPHPQVALHSSLRICRQR